MIPRKSVPIKRHPAGTYERGKFVPGGSPTEGTIRASVQPVTGEKMRVLRENEEAESAYYLYTNDEVHTVREEQQIPADDVTINGLDHIVYAVEVWENKIIPHLKVTAIRRKTGK